MTHSSAELKRMARTALNGKWGTSAAFTAFMLLFTVGISLVSFLFDSPATLIASIIYWAADIIISLITGLFSAGAAYFYLNIGRGEKFGFSDLFAAFRMNPDRFLIVSLITSGITFICTLPTYLWIPTDEDYLLYTLVTLACVWIGSIVSLILSLFFAISHYLLLDYPEMGAIDSLRASARLMKGNKGRYFYISLSFLGWVFLGLFTLCIGLLWIAPYMNMTFTYFYLDILNQLDNIQKQEGYAENFAAYENNSENENDLTNE